MHQLSHQSHDHSDSALLFGQSQRENNELGKGFINDTKCLMLKLWGYNMEHHLSCPLLTVHQMFHSQIPHQLTIHVTERAWLGCCSVIHMCPPFLGRSGFHLCANRLWQWDLKSQTAEQLGCALQQAQSS